MHSRQNIVKNPARASYRRADAVPAAAIAPVLTCLPKLVFLRRAGPSKGLLTILKQDQASPVPRLTTRLKQRDKLDADHHQCTPENPADARRGVGKPEPGEISKTTDNTVDASECRRMRVPLARRTASKRFQSLLA